MKMGVVRVGVRRHVSSSGIKGTHPPCPRVAIVDRGSETFLDKWERRRTHSSRSAYVSIVRVKNWRRTEKMASPLE